MDNPYTESWNKASIALDASGNPHVAYAAYTGLGGDPLIKYAYRDGSDWHLETEGMVNIINSCVGLDLDTNDKPHIAYFDDGFARQNVRYRCYLL